MVSGGGTGGHTSPAIAIIEEIQQRDPQLALQWVGKRNSIEQRLSDSLSIPFRTLPVEGWPRSRSPRKLWVAFKMGVAVLRAFFLIRRFRPQVILGVGGYVSLPLLWVAQHLGIPTVLHEQNKRLGLANRILAQKASKILLSFPDTAGDYPRENATVVGNPVRAGFTAPPSKEEALKQFALHPNIPVILICGGSQGARSINAALEGAIRQFEPDEIQFLWVTGNTDIQKARTFIDTVPAYTINVHPFIEDMPAACTVADLVVGRAGASSTAELALMGKPSILIPYPHATDNHQMANARAFEDAGAATVLPDDACTGDTLAQEIKALLNAPNRLKTMGDMAKSISRPVAVEGITEELLSLVFESS
jgi:UDP-N-acetylglucosamine--N-acetylmuramyl-(pentapeptide) pyrophosphoryl-undecaprenol N-acetylglucosamine transferase